MSSCSCVPSMMMVLFQILALNLYLGPVADSGLAAVRGSWLERLRGIASTSALRE